MLVRVIPSVLLPEVMVDNTEYFEQLIVELPFEATLRGYAGLLTGKSREIPYLKGQHPGFAYAINSTVMQSGASSWLFEYQTEVPLINHNEVGILHGTLVLYLRKWDWALRVTPCVNNDDGPRIPINIPKFDFRPDKGGEQLPRYDRELAL